MLHQESELMIDDIREFADIVAELADNGLCVRPAFLSDREVEELLGDMRALYERGLFRPAGIGHQASHQFANEIRKDLICWFEPRTLTSAQLQLWRKIELFKEELNRELFLGLWDFEAHFAIYNPGGFYKSHRDSFEASNKRAVSIVLYLNTDWKKGDGGELKVEVGGGQKIIEPIAGTMVCFLSEMIEHQVMTAHCERKSIAAWLRRR